MAALNKIRTNNQPMDVMITWMTQTQINQQNQSSIRCSGKRFNLIDKWFKKKKFMPLYCKIDDHGNARVQALLHHGHTSSQWHAKEGKYYFPVPKCFTEMNHNQNRQQNNDNK